MADDSTRVSMSVNGGEEFDVTALFEESPEERAARQAFYDPGGIDSQKPVSNVIRSLEVGVSGGLRPSRKLDRRERCTVIIHDADGEVIASGEGTIGGIGFKDKVKDGYLFVTRVCKVKLD